MPALESIGSPSNYPARVGFFTDDQIAQRSTWGRVPDSEMTAAAMHVIHTVPRGASTTTYVNRLDPGTVEDTGEGPGWLERPGGWGSIYRNRPAWWAAG